MYHSARTRTSLRSVIPEPFHTHRHCTVITAEGRIETLIIRTAAFGGEPWNSRSRSWQTMQTGGNSVTLNHHVVKPFSDPIPHNGS